jgi:thiamine transport system permease protein
MPFQNRGVLLAVIPVAFLTVFSVYPLLKLLSLGFSLEVLKSTLGNPYYQGRVLWTLAQALGSTALTVVLGVPAAVVFARYDFRGKRALLAVLTLPFVVPTIVAAIGFLALFGPRGLTGINLSRSAWLIVLANVFYNYALVVRLVSSYLSGVGPRLEEAARVMGSSAIRTFWRVTLPVAMPAILASSALVFLYTFASFGVPLILGGGRWNTLEVEVYQLVANQLKLTEAGALALVQLVITGAATALYTTWQSRSSVTFEVNATRPKARGFSSLWLALNVILALTITLAPLGAMVVRSLSSAEGLTFQNYARAFQPSNSVFVTSTPLAVWNSMRFALGTLVVAVPLGLLYALAVWRSRSRVLDALSLLPLTVSAALLGLAYLIAFPSLRASLVLLFAAYSLVAYPFVTRSSLTALRAMPKNALEAARVLGSSPLRAFWRVTLPLISPALATGTAFAFASVVGEFGATLVLSRPEWTTLSGAIYERLGRPGQLGEATALATILLVVTTIGFLALDRIRGKSG